MPVPPLPPAVSVTVPPLQIGPLFVGDAVGTASTVTVVVYTVTGLQPLPVLVTVSEYVLVIVGVAVGLATAPDDKFGPLHE